jgi:hypothetical protein
MRTQRVPSAPLVPLLLTCGSARRGTMTGCADNTAFLKSSEMCSQLKSTSSGLAGAKPKRLTAPSGWLLMASIAAREYLYGPGANAGAGCVASGCAAAGTAAPRSLAADAAIAEGAASTSSSAADDLGTSTSATPHSGAAALVAEAVALSTCACDTTGCRRGDCACCMVSAPAAMLAAICSLTVDCCRLRTTLAKSSAAN